MNLDRARAVADAVMYEGYLLYPYRPSSGKNQARWQFGVLGPAGAAAAGLGEEPGMAMQCLLRVCGQHPELLLRLRFLQLQRRQVYDLDGCAVERLGVNPRWTSWDEAVEHEVPVTVRLEDLARPLTAPIGVPGGEESERLTTGDGTAIGRIVRARQPLAAELTVRATEVGGFRRIEVRVSNTHAEDWERSGREHPADAVPAVAARSAATRVSLLGAHLLLEAHDAAFVSLLEPPPEAAELAAGCRQHRCWPVLAGDPGEVDLVLGSPIILYDYPEVAPESAMALYDATEIDEILTLRVMTMTDAEKAEARATDLRAREVIDRCDALTGEELQRLHGTVRGGVASEGDTDIPWWDPDADAAVDPGTDSVLVAGRAVGRGSRVRVQPKRRADAQDLFFVDQVARVTAVVRDVDGNVHLALVLEDDPAADLHEWYGRYLYFSPEEVEPLAEAEDTVSLGNRKEGQP